MKTLSQNTVVIVNGVSTGKYLAQLFAQEGWAAVHLKSAPENEDIPNPEDYIEQINYTGDMFELLQALSFYHVKCVIAGADEGIYLADKLAAALSLPGNSPLTTDLRRDKYLMAECLAQKGLASIPHFKSGDVHAIVAWAEQQNQWPVVLKPVDGAGTEGLSVCTNVAEIIEASKKLLQIQGQLGYYYTTMLCQPFIRGTEYIVNTVSVGGKHYVTDIWCYTKKIKNNAIIYDRTSALPATGIIQESLTDYIYAVLDALEVQEGAAHSEVMLTSQGPVLIEVNQRLMGFGMRPQDLATGFGMSQAEWLVLRHTDPMTYQTRTLTPYKLKKSLICVQHIVERENTCCNPNAFAKIKKLESYVYNKFMGEFNTPLKATRDLATAYGWVLLAHADEHVLARDIEQFRKIEREDLFLMSEFLHKVA